MSVVSLAVDFALLVMEVWPLEVPSNDCIYFFLIMFYAYTILFYYLFFVVNGWKTLLFINKSVQGSEEVNTYMHKETSREGQTKTALEPAVA